MARTKTSQRQAKQNTDEKLANSVPTRDLLEELAVQCAKDPSPDNTFQYGFCLSKSRQESELRYAITILDGLIRDGYEHQVDCMVGCANAFYILGEYEEARTRCESVLRSHPDNRIAAELHLAAIGAAEESEQRRAKKAAVVGGAVAVLGIAAMALAGKR